MHCHDSYEQSMKAVVNISLNQESQIDPALKDLLNAAGIKTNILKDEGTAEFIKSFVDDHGGLAAVKERQRRQTMRGLIYYLVS